MSSHDKKAVRKLCKCGAESWWFCTCPPPAHPARPAWRETYPPLHCIICATPMFKLPYLNDNHIANLTCGEDCRKEGEHRYYLGTVLQKPYKPTQLRLPL